MDDTQTKRLENVTWSNSPRIIVHNLSILQVDNPLIATTFLILSQISEV